MMAEITAVQIDEHIGIGGPIVQQGMGKNFRKGSIGPPRKNLVNVLVIDGNFFHPPVFGRLVDQRYDRD